MHEQFTSRTGRPGPYGFAHEAPGISTVLHGVMATFQHPERPTWIRSSSPARSRGVPTSNAAQTSVNSVQCRPQREVKVTRILKSQMPSKLFQTLFKQPHLFLLSLTDFVSIQRSRTLTKKRNAKRIACVGASWTLARTNIHYRTQLDQGYSHSSYTPMWVAFPVLASHSDLHALEWGQTSLRPRTDQPRRPWITTSFLSPR